jgi:hypothetical protein
MKENTESLCVSEPLYCYVAQHDLGEIVQVTILKQQHSFRLF